MSAAKKKFKAVLNSHYCSGNGHVAKRKEPYYIVPATPAAFEAQVQVQVMSKVLMSALTYPTWDHAVREGLAAIGITRPKQPKDGA